MKALFRILSGLSINLSTAWFGAIFVGPYFSQEPIPFPVLWEGIFYGTTYALFAFGFEFFLENE